MSENGKIALMTEGNPYMERIQAILCACKQAVETEGMSWEDTMVKKTRLRKVVEVRYAIFDIFRKAVPVSYGTAVEMLGTSLNRTTLYYAIRCVREWRDYNLIYSGTYDRISSNFHSALRESGYEKSE